MQWKEHVGLSRYVYVGCSAIYMEDADNAQDTHGTSIGVTTRSHYIIPGSQPDPVLRGHHQQVTTKECRIIKGVMRVSASKIPQ